MERIVITFPLKITSALSVNSTLHYQVKYRQKMQIESLVIAALMEAKVKKTISTEGRLQLTFHWDSDLDIDNHGRIRKAIIDAVSKYINSGHDDATKVGRTIEEFWDGKCVKVEIEVKDDMPMPSVKIARKPMAKKSCATNH